MRITVLECFECNRVNEGYDEMEQNYWYKKNSTTFVVLAFPKNK